MTTNVSRFVRSLAIAAALVPALFGVQACGENPLNPSDFGIEVTDLVVGNGTEVRTGRGATVHYTLWLLDDNRPDRKGTQIETSLGRQPFSFPVGYGQVIRGWDIGVPGMRVGGTRLLIVPPDQAYGASGTATIPPNATLVFEIQLVGVY